MMIAVIIWLVSNGSNARADEALKLADYLYDQEAYPAAITEYQRFIFFNPKGENISYAYCQVGNANKHLRQWPEAIDAFKSAIASTANDSIRDERKIDLAVTMIASENYSAAEVELLRLAYFSKNEYLKSKASFFLCVNAIYIHRWNDARVALRNYEGSSSTIDTMFADAEHTPLKSPRLAKTLSTFVPGLGQIYAGNWFNGLNAAALDISLGYLVADALVEENYAGAMLDYFMLFFRYYQGNRENASTLAEKHNERLNQDFKVKILDQLYNDTAKK